MHSITNFITIILALLSSISSFAESNRSDEAFVFIMAADGSGFHIKYRSDQDGLRKIDLKDRLTPMVEELLEIDDLPTIENILLRYHDIGSVDGNLSESEHSDFPWEEFYFVANKSFRDSSIDRLDLLQLNSVGKKVSIDEAIVLINEMISDRSKILKEIKSFKSKKIESESNSQNSLRFKVYGVTKCYFQNECKGPLVTIKKKKIGKNHKVGKISGAIQVKEHGIITVDEIALNLDTWRSEYIDGSYAYGERHYPAVDEVQDYLRNLGKYSEESFAYITAEIKGGRFPKTEKRRIGKWLVKI